MRKKAALATVTALLSFLAVTGAVYAQSASPSASPMASPSSAVQGTSTTVPSAAPSTGRG